MKQLLFKITIVFFSMILFSCASTPPPSWVLNYKSEYPSEDYIVQQGSGTSELFARTDALRKISEYFQTTVDSSVQAQLKTLSSNDLYQEYRATSTEVNVTSQVDLFGVEYLEPYYNKADKRWYVLAYISKQTAWKMYQPKIEVAKNAFYVLYDIAEETPEPIIKQQYYKAAFNKGTEFIETLEYGRLINKQCDLFYNNDKETVFSVPAKISDAIKNSSMKMIVTGDYENIISTAVANVFTEAGYTIAKTKSNYDLYVTVTDNLSSSTDAVSVTPDIDIKLVSNKGETVYSFQYKGTKKVAFSASVAKQRSFKETSTELEAKLAENLAAAFNL